MRFNALFWPGLLIVIGILLLLRSIFPWNIPVGRLVVGVLVIFAGVSILTGGVFGAHWQGTVFTNTMDKPTASKEYNTVFGSSRIDLTALTAGDYTFKINTAFGNTNVEYPSWAKVNVKASGAFCSIRMPNGRDVNFGNGEENIGPDSATVRITLDLSSAFGEIRLTSR